MSGLYVMLSLFDLHSLLGGIECDVDEARGGSIVARLGMWCGLAGMFMVF